MFKKLKKIMGLMEEKELSEIRGDYNKFSYQWIKGENISKIQHYKDVIELDNKKYLVFTDGSRISLDLLDEYMVKVDPGYDEDPITPQSPGIEILNISQKSGVKKRETREISSPSQNHESPIFSLLSKQKENWVDVDLKLSINLPPRSLWDVLLSSFDDAENDILEYVTKDLDIEVVRQSLRESIKEIYKKQKISTSLKNVRTQDPISE